MDIKFSCKGMWHADEVAVLVEQQFGFTPEVSTSDGEIIVHPRPRALEKQEIEWLREYLKEHPQKSSEDRMAEEEQAAEARRQETILRVTKVTDSAAVSLNAVEVRDAVRALAELAGVDVGTAGVDVSK